MLRDEAYVPFNLDFSENDGTSKIITGPNMAGRVFAPIRQSRLSYRQKLLCPCYCKLT